MLRLRSGGRGVEKGNTYKLNQPEEEYICFSCMP